MSTLITTPMKPIKCWCIPGIHLESYECNTVWANLLRQNVFRNRKSVGLRMKGRVKLEQCGWGAEKSIKLRNVVALNYSTEFNEWSWKFVTYDLASKAHRQFPLNILNTISKNSFLFSLLRSSRRSEIYWLNQIKVASHQSPLFTS